MFWNIVAKEFPMSLSSIWISTQKRIETATLRTTYGAVENLLMSSTDVQIFHFTILCYRHVTVTIWTMSENLVAATNSASPKRQLDTIFNSVCV